jgi:hypothetical protein
MSDLNNVNGGGAGGGEGVGSGGGGNEQSVHVMNPGQLFLGPLDWGDRAPRNNVSGW